MTFKNLPLVQKLGVGFGAVLLIVALSCALILKQTRGLAEIERLSAASDDIVQLMGQVQADAALARSARYKIVLSGDKADLTGYRDVKAALTKHFSDASDLINKTAPQYADRLEILRVDLVKNYVEAFLDPQVSLAIDAATRDQALVSATSASSNVARKSFETELTSLKDDIATWSTNLTDQAASTMAATEWVVALSGVTSLLMGLGMAWFIARSVGGPLNQMIATMRLLSNGNHDVEVPARDQTDEIGQMAGAVQLFKVAAIEKLRIEAEAITTQRAAHADREVGEAVRVSASQQQAQVVEKIANGLNRLASGDLLQRIDHPFAPEYESLRTDFNAAIAQLKETIKDVSTSTGTIRTGTGEISNASDELSRRTEQQAASLEETAAALVEITSAMQLTSAGASHAREVVGVAETTADQSSDVISRTIQAMSNIEKASQQISQILGVIDQIAFQTNLLALNAGVEAARAGDAGRGFAVVASEVRALAQRCAEAAKEVKGLVLTSDEQVQSGVNLVAESGKMLSQIVAQVKELKTIVNDIAGSAAHQAAGLSEVNIAIRQMDQVTQQNAAMAEEATAAAHNLAREGTELVRLVGKFNVGAAPLVAVVPKRSAAAVKLVPRPALKRVVGGGSSASRAPAVAADDWQEF